MNFDNDEESLEFINRLFERLHQADYKALGCINVNIYKPGSQHVDRVEMQYISLTPRSTKGRMPVSSRKVSLVMKNLDYTPQHSKSGNIYRLYELKPDEQQLAMSAMLNAEMTDNQADAADQELLF